MVFYKITILFSSGLIQPRCVTTFTNVLSKYPDFTVGFTLEQIALWAEDNNIKLETEYITTEDYPNGTILYQSREKDSVVLENATLKITITKKPEKEEEPVKPEDNKEPAQGDKDAGENN